CRPDQLPLPAKARSRPRSIQRHPTISTTYAIPIVTTARTTSTATALSLRPAFRPCDAGNASAINAKRKSSRKKAHKAQKKSFALFVLFVAALKATDSLLLHSQTLFSVTDPL